MSEMGHMGLTPEELASLTPEELAEVRQAYADGYAAGYPEGFVAGLLDADRRVPLDPDDEYRDD